MNKFRLPGRDSRTTIIGETGSGKTVFSAWLLSQADLGKRPWHVFDTKRDPFFASLVKGKQVSVADINQPPPKEPGVHILQPRLNQKDKINDYLWKLWERGRCGVWVDELYSMPQDDALEALYYQGRAKQIQIIGCVQRPAWITRFAFSEAGFFSLFTVGDGRDFKLLEQLLRFDLPRSELERYHCVWRDCGQKATFHLTPAPKPAKSMEAIESQLPYRYWR